MIHLKKVIFVFITLYDIKLLEKGAIPKDFTHYGDYMVTSNLLPDVKKSIKKLILAILSPDMTL